MVSTRLKLIRTDFGLSQKAFGDLLGIAQTSYANYESGKSSLPSNVLETLQQKTGVNLNWLVTGQGSMKLGESDEKVPIYNKVEDETTFMVPMTNLKVSAGYGIDWNSGQLSGELIPVPRKLINKYGNLSHIAAAEVRGDSMSPTLKDGEPVVFSRGLIDGDGIYVIAILGELFVKRICIDRLKNKVTIISDNPKYPIKEYDLNIEGFEVIGKVIFWIHEE